MSDLTDMTETGAQARGKLTGWHVLAMFVAFFGTVVTVNLFMAFQAVGTFPGVEAKNGFVASQTFEERRSAQVALGWDVAADVSDGVLTLTLTDATGQPAALSELSAIFGHATNVADDQVPDFTYVGQGAFTAPVEASPGNWNLRVSAVAADGTPFQQRVVLRIR